MTAWRSVLPHLGYDLPADLSPPAATGPVTTQVPLELVRQSISRREWWPVPEPVAEIYRTYRPTPLWRAVRFEAAVGARVPIYVKYEGGNLSGSHKLTTALAQAYYYRQAGVRELVTGTGAGQWGTALATACAAFGLSCTVFMVGGSLRAKPYRGSLMRLLGATVHASPSPLTEVGARDTAGNSLALAIGEAVEYARGARDRAFCIGSGETYSILHQSLIGLEALEQLAGLDAEVDTVVGCVGAGSNFGGLALPFFAAHAAGETGDAPPLLLAAESCATPKLSRGVYAYDVTDATGTGPMEAMYTIGAGYPIPAAHAAGLRFHGAAKLLSAMRHHDQIAAVAVGQQDALAAGRRFALAELILPAPESGHALAAAASVASGRSGRGVLVCVSGHGLLDLSAYDDLLAGVLEDAPVDEAALRAATSGLRPAGSQLTGVS
ncbi:MAG TPA: TrpB-like pyridoxal phosphate-dependent enzyme [Actinophytocola sp.]|uniref:TrpB-like pyridoxal phosphate-dependent enzyme n=1 Tax=Actinophytocola sp. TaxID=1872138 RepID=UPI002DBA49E5|nr:TrpB-like pyridoxal phosphate-dependent enzyme [Actinophytocola sp.]HEU5471324.1 TrpB-like pyridoxal phosphate-dependent enzyme [Actinophytocola sp.]